MKAERAPIKPGSYEPRRTYMRKMAVDHGKSPGWKWWCQSCGTLTNDGECDCTFGCDNADLQVLIRNP